MGELLFGRCGGRAGAGHFCEGGCNRCGITFFIIIQYAFSRTKIALNGLSVGCSYDISDYSFRASKAATLAEIHIDFCYSTCSCLPKVEICELQQIGNT